MSIEKIIKSITINKSITIKNPELFNGISTSDVCLDESYVYVTSSNTVVLLRKEELEFVSSISLPSSSIWRCVAHKGKLYLVGTKTVVRISQDLKQLEEKPLFPQKSRVDRFFIPYCVTTYDDRLLAVGMFFNEYKGSYTATVAKIDTDSLELEDLQSGATYSSIIKCTPIYSVAVDPNTDYVWAVGASSNQNMLCIDILDFKNRENVLSKTLHDFGIGIDVAFDPQGNAYVITHDKNLLKLGKMFLGLELLKLGYKQERELAELAINKSPLNMMPLSIVYANGFVALLAVETAQHPKVIIYDEDLKEVDKLDLIPQVPLLGGKLLFDGKKIFAALTGSLSTIIYSIHSISTGLLIDIIVDNTIERINAYQYRDKQLSDMIYMCCGKKEFTEIYVFDGVELKKVDVNEKVENVLKSSVKFIYVV